MINHFRTLLLNIAPAKDLEINAPGEEYIDPSFSPLLLTGKLKDSQGVLVPASAPRNYKNFYGYALMCLAQAPDFEKYIITFDSRIVYDISDSIYISADVARGTYPQFSISTLYVSLSSAMMKPGPSLFDAVPAYSEDMAIFKDVWYSSPSYKDKVTAGIFAIVYAMEGVRLNG